MLIVRTRFLMFGHFDSRSF